MKNKLSILIVILLVFTFIPLVSSVPPVTTTQQFTENYVIIDSPQVILKQNKDFTINFFVYNSSNGLLIDNTTTECVYYLSNSSGDVLHYSSVSYSKEGRYGHWKIKILGNNFSKMDIFPYGIKCNSTSFGGTLVGEYKVTYNGEELTTQKAILNLGFLLIMILFFVLIIFGIVSIDSEDKTDNYGDIISVNNLKYFKGFLVAVAYSMMIAIFFLSSNLAIAYLSTDMFGKILFVLYRILMLGGVPFIILWVLWLFINIFRDKETQRLMDRGIGGEQS
jgi:hypothetical protein